MKTSLVQRIARNGAVLAVVAALTALTACSSGTGGGSATGGAAASSTLTYGTDADSAPNGYDPLAYSQTQYTFFSTMYDALFVTDAKGEVQPHLVTTSSSNPDNTQLTLKLKDGVAFADGSKLDAALVKKNLDQRSTKDLVAYGQIAPGGASEITDVSAPDATTVVITWKTPQANGKNALADTAGVIIGPKSVENRAALKTAPDGSGAYTLNASKTTRGNTYTLDKSNTAWDAATWPYAHVVWKIFTDPQARANAVVSGQVDVASPLGANTISVVQSRQSIVKAGGTVVGFPVADTTGATNPAFAKLDVRLALLYAIDRDTLVKSLHPGGLATAQLFPSTATGFDPALNTKYAYNKDKAKQLLAGAGFANGFTIDLTVLGQPTDDQIAVQKQWAELGVMLNFKVATSTDAIFAAVNTQPLLFGSFPVGNQPAGFVAGVLYGGFMNPRKTKDPAIEASLGAALGTTGAQQESALKDLNAAITNDGWFLPIYEDFIYAGYNKSKVTAPAFAGTNGYIVLSSIKAAA